MTDSDRHDAEHADDAAGSGQHAEGHGDSGADGGQEQGSSRKRSEWWSEAHEAFDRLSVEEKAFFLVESAFETMVKGLREAGDAVKNAMDEALSDLEKRKREAGHHDTNGHDASDEGGDAAGSDQDA